MYNRNRVIALAVFRSAAVAHHSTKKTVLALLPLSEFVMP